MIYLFAGYVFGVASVAFGMLLAKKTERKVKDTGRAPTKEELETEQRKAEQWEALLGYTGPRR